MSLPFKEMFSRKRILPLVLFVSAVVVVRWINRNNVVVQEPVVFTIHGQTMGTYYDIKYVATEEFKLQKGVDSVLNRFEGLLSNWIPTSDVSRFNASDTISNYSDEFAVLLNVSAEVYQETEGAFDPTVGPLIKRWGFAEKERNENPTQFELDSLNQLVGFNKIETSNGVTTKLHGVELNLSAIAKGYGCDVVAAHLDFLGLQNYKVEIGGEVYCKGIKPEVKPWKIGIEKPVEGQQELHSVVIIDNCAMATSGNYRNFFVKDGVKYAHTIDPKTGKPVQREILSASVVAENCMLADAYATAFMVMGLEKTKKLCANRNDLDVFLIYELEEGNQEVWMTEGMKNRIASND